MDSHFLLLVVFSVLVATVFAVLQRETPAEQLRAAVVMAAGFVGAAVALGWLMAPFPL